MNQEPGEASQAHLRYFRAAGRARWLGRSARGGVGLRLGRRWGWGSGDCSGEVAGLEAWVGDSGGL